MPGNIDQGDNEQWVQTSQDGDIENQRHDAQQWLSEVGLCPMNMGGGFEVISFLTVSLMRLPVRHHTGQTSVPFVMTLPGTNADCRHGEPSPHLHGSSIKIR